MREWIIEPHSEDWTEFDLVLDCLEHSSSGYRFDCDKDGNVLGNEFATKEQRELQLLEIVATGKYTFPRVERRERSWFNPGVLRCVCGREHHLARGDSTCECGQWFNACGQQLNPPEMWEENYEEDY